MDEKQLQWLVSGFKRRDACSSSLDAWLISTVGKRRLSWGVSGSAYSLLEARLPKMV